MEQKDNRENLVGLCVLVNCGSLDWYVFHALDSVQGKEVDFNWFTDVKNLGRAEVVIIDKMDKLEEVKPYLGREIKLPHGTLKGKIVLYCPESMALEQVFPEPEENDPYSFSRVGGHTSTSSSED